jgi:hypothetical protein
MKMNAASKIKNVFGFASRLAVLLSLWTIAFAAPAQAATASFFTSGGGKVNTNQNITVTVSVNGSEAYNAVEVNVNFSNLTFISAAATGGWTTFSGPTRSGNTVNYVGALFGSSATGSRNILNLTFRAPGNAGNASISSSGTITILNGNTKVSGGGNTASFSVQTPPPAPTPSPTPRPAADAVKISSTSHSDPAQWYKAKDVAILWEKAAGVTEFSYLIDSAAATNPDETAEGSDVSKTFSNVADGTSYFHIKARNDVGWGPASHFQINIDSTSPDPFSLTKIDDTESGNFKLFFATNDAGSGIARYTISVDGQDKGEQKSGYVVNKDAGTVTITATDKAGNSTQTTSDLKKTPVATVVTSVPEDSQAATKVETPAKEGNSISTTLLYVALGLLFCYGIAITVFYLRGMKNGQQNSASKADKEDKK